MAKRERTYYQDTWNDQKTWEVTKLCGGFYLRQYIAGKQFGSGMKTSKKFIREIGILNMKQITQ